MVTNHCGDVLPLNRPDRTTSTSSDEKVSLLADYSTRKMMVDDPGWPPPQIYQELTALSHHYRWRLSKSSIPQSDVSALNYQPG